MENREAIEALRDLLDTTREYPHLDGMTMFGDAIDMAISALKKQEQDRWHSVAKEGNPKERGFYLWTSKDGTVREDLYRICDNTWTWCIAWRDGYDVVAWRPLPEPYKEEEA